MPTRIAARMSEIRPFQVMELLRRALELEAAGRDIVHMEIGEPDFATPAPIVAAAQRFLAQGRIGYTPALGLPSLREAIANHYQSQFGATVDAERIVVTTGASGALLLLICALTEPGDEWLIPDPGYPSNRHFVRAFEGKPTALPVGPDSAYQPTPAQVAAAWKPHTRGLMVASPSNPTGTLLSLAQMTELQATCKAHDGILLVDEIYQGLVYDEPARSILSTLDEALVINSFSKYFGMTGWRLGWLVVPPQMCNLLPEIEKLAQHFYISPSSPAQHAALAAFSPEMREILENRRAELEQRRNVLLPALQELGFRISSPPQGAYYLYADVSDWEIKSSELSRRLLEEAGVACTPGIDFGEHRAESHLRFAYSQSIERINTGVERIRNFARTVRG